jgi:hypothetical protein
MLTVNVAGASSLVLPPAPTTGTVFIVKDVSGNASTNNITITVSGGVVTIDGTNSALINTDYGALNFIFNGTEWNVY